MNLPVANLVALTSCALLACSDDGAAPVERMRDGGMADAASTDASADSGRDAGSCPRRRAQGLTQIPAQVVAPVSGSTCKTYPARYLMANDTPADVQVERLSTEAFASGARFTASSQTALPHTLKPGEVLTVELELTAPDAEADTLIEGNLVVHHDDGCDWMLIKGLVERKGSVGGGPWAVDMGVLAPGARGEPVPIVFGFASVGPVSRPPTKLTTMKVDPEPAFELVSGFDEAPAPCDELTAWVRFNAPARRGVVEGVLGWELSDGEFLGLAEITLRGLVR
jgi:hypothetical protein